MIAGVTPRCVTPSGMGTKDGLEGIRGYCERGGHAPDSFCPQAICEPPASDCLIVTNQRS